MSKPNADELSYTMYPICPHCGDEELDAWELVSDDESSEVYECGSCEGAMLITRHVSVTYTTAIAKAKGEQP